MIVREIQPADQALFQSFDCGSEPYETAISRFIKTDYWSMPQDERPSILLGVCEHSGEPVGYGAWIRAEADLAGDVVEVLRVIRFGVDSRHKGRIDEATGLTYAQTLYEAVEARSVEDLGELPIELFCDTENRRGLRFWKRRGFTALDTVGGGQRRYRRFIR